VARPQKPLGEPELTALLRTLAVFKRPTSKGREGNRKGRRRKGKGEKMGEEVEGFGPSKNFGVAPPTKITS